MHTTLELWLSHSISISIRKHVPGQPLPIPSSTRTTFFKNRGPQSTSLIKLMASSHYSQHLLLLLLRIQIQWKRSCPRWISVLGYPDFLDLFHFHRDLNMLLQNGYEHFLRPAILTTAQIFLQHSAKNKYLGSRLDGDPCLGKTGSKYF